MLIELLAYACVEKMFGPSFKGKKVPIHSPPRSISKPTNTQQGTYEAVITPEKKAHFILHKPHASFSWSCKTRPIISVSSDE